MLMINPYKIPLVENGISPDKMSLPQYVVEELIKSCSEEAEPVKKATWLTRYKNGSKYTVCSNCTAYMIHDGKRLDLTGTSYCMSCGARMGEE